jgi:hypothetical protein
MVQLATLLAELLVRCNWLNKLKFLKKYNDFMHEKQWNFIIDFLNLVVLCQVT